MFRQGLIAAIALICGLALTAPRAKADPWPAPEPRGDASACIVQVFWDSNYAGESWITASDQAYVGDHWNDQISSVKVIAGVWEFYFDANYQGEMFRTGPGRYPFVGQHWNDQISSFRCVEPTRVGR